MNLNNVFIGNGILCLCSNQQLIGNCLDYLHIALRDVIRNMVHMKLQKGDLTPHFNLFCV